MSAEAAVPAAAVASSAAPPELVRCAGLAVGYRGKALLPPFDLTLSPGEILLVVGRNGSGKTTFVRSLLGLLPAVGGTIARRAERLAYVPQSTPVDATVPVRAGDVVAWGRLRGWSFLRPWAGRGDRQACRQALADLGVAELERRRLSELSGGQQQRVLLARMLAGDAELAVLDEPTAAMDATSELAAFRRLRELAHERGIGIVVVTHEVAVAAPFADGVAFFDPDDPATPGGRVVVGPTAVVTAQPRFRALFGRVDLTGANGAV